MKKTISIIIFIITGKLLIGQITIPAGSQKEIDQFLKNTTYVVLKNTFLSDYNEMIMEAINEHWDITPVEFIKETDFNKLRSDAGKSFLVINQVYFEKDKSKTLFDFLILTNGGNFKTVDEMPTLCGVPLSYHNAPETDYSYKLGLIVKFIQHHTRICKENPALNKENIADYYIQLSGNTKEKTLYVLNDEIDPKIRNKNIFSQYYPYNFEFTSKEYISQLIKDNDKTAIILHQISPQADSSLTYCIKIIIDTDKALIYYYDMTKINKNNPPFLLIDDLKKLSNKK